MIKVNFGDLGKKEEVDETFPIAKWKGYQVPVIQKIIKHAGITSTEIKELVDEKKKELKGLIADDGALEIIARDLGITLPKEEDDLLGGNKTNDEVAVVEESLLEEAKIIDKQPPSMPSSKVITKNQDLLNPNPKQNKYPLEAIPIKNQAIAINIEEAKKQIDTQIELYNYTITSIINEKDFARIQGRQHLCKSGVRKIQLALNISTEIVSHNKWKDGDQWVAEFIVRAIAPNGRSAESIAICVQNEKGRNRTLHDTIATAQTRATSRAILDLVGFGATSASEMGKEDDLL